MGRHNPNSLATLPAQRLKVNPRDHLAAWLEEEFVLGEGHVQLGALFKAYEWWCCCRKVTNRRLTPVLLLDRIKEQYGIEPRTVYFVDQGEQRSAYALPDIRFRYDEGLNRRLKARGMDTRTISPRQEDDDE